MNLTMSQTEMFRPKIVKRWKGAQKVIRLVFDGVNFVVQCGDDKNGYEQLTSNEAVNTLGTVIMLDIKTLQDGECVYWEQNPLGKMTEKTQNGDQTK